MQNKNLNYEKYLKYKNKYLNLMNQIGGAGDDDKSCIKITPALSSDNIIKVNIKIFNNNLNDIFNSFKSKENNIVVELTNFYCGILATFLLNNLMNDAISFYNTVVLPNPNVAIAVLEEFDTLAPNSVLTEFRDSIDRIL